MSDKRSCYYIPADAFIEGRGYRVSVVFENQPGHHPTGTWPYNGRVGEKLPYFWGDDYEGAKRICVAQNEQMGIGEEDAFDIVTSSMRMLEGRRESP